MAADRAAVGLNMDSQLQLDLDHCAFDMRSGPLGQQVDWLLSTCSREASLLTEIVFRL